MDIHMNYIDVGSGIPMILLHGNGENCGYFYHQINHFSSRFRVIAVDTRGHGGTPRGSAPFTIQQFAHDLGDFMDEMGIPEAIILGFSDGANIAMKFALTYPERVIALILNGGNLNGFGVQTKFQISITAEYLFAKAYARKSEDAYREAELLGLMVKDPNIKPKQLRNIQAPTLVISGTDDLIKPSHSRKIASNIPGAKLILLPGDHNIAGNSPYEFNAAVDAFLYESL